MKCDSCSNPATIHLTDIVNGKKKEVHLCQECAEEKHLLQQQELNISAILQTVLAGQVGSGSDKLARLTCPICGIKYMEFRAEGRFGCPNDYQVFKSALEPLLKRIHRNVRHEGKIPRCGIQHTGRAEQRSSPHADIMMELLDYRRQLRSAVESENYEEAARLRDILRQKEAEYESG